MSYRTFCVFTQKINRKEDKKEYVQRKCREHNKDIGRTSSTSDKRTEAVGETSRKVSFRIQDVGPGGDTNSKSETSKVSTEKKARSSGSPKSPSCTKRKLSDSNTEQRSPGAQGSTGPNPTKRQRMDIITDANDMSQSDSEDPFIIPNSQQAQHHKGKSHRRLSLPVFTTGESAHHGSILNKTFTISTAPTTPDGQDIDVTMTNESVVVRDVKEMAKTGCQNVSSDNKVKLRDGENEDARSSGFKSRSVACIESDAIRVSVDKKLDKDKETVLVVGESQLSDFNQTESSESQNVTLPSQEIRRKRGRKKKLVNSLDYSFLDDDAHDMYSQIKNRRRSHGTSHPIYLDSNYSIDTSLLQYSEELISQNVSIEASPLDGKLEHPVEQEQKVPLGSVETSEPDSQLDNPADSSWAQCPDESPQITSTPNEGEILSTEIPVVPKLSVTENIMHFTLPDSQYAQFKLKKGYKNPNNMVFIPASDESVTLKEGGKSKKERREPKVAKSSKMDKNSKDEVIKTRSDKSFKTDNDVSTEKCTQGARRGKWNNDKAAKVTQKTERNKGHKKERKKNEDNVTNVKIEKTTAPIITAQTSEKTTAKGKVGRSVGVRGKKGGRPKKDQVKSAHESDGVNNVRIQETREVSSSAVLSGHKCDTDTVQAINPECDVYEYSSNLNEVVENELTVHVRSKRVHSAGKPRRGRGRSLSRGLLKYPDDLTVKQNADSIKESSKEDKNKLSSNLGNEIAVMINVAGDIDIDISPDNLSTPVSETLFQDWYQGSGGFVSTDGHYSDAVKDSKPKSDKEVGIRDVDKDSDPNRELKCDQDDLQDNKTVRGFVNSKIKVDEFDKDQKKDTVVTGLAKLSTDGHSACVTECKQTEMSEKNRVLAVNSAPQSQNQKARRNQEKIAELSVSRNRRDEKREKLIQGDKNFKGSDGGNEVQQNETNNRDQSRRKEVKNKAVHSPSEDEFGLPETVEDGNGQLLQLEADEQEIAPVLVGHDGEEAPPDTESEEEFALKQTPEIEEFLQQEAEDEEEFALPVDKQILSLDSDNNHDSDGDLNVAHLHEIRRTQPKEPTEDVVPDTEDNVSSQDSDTKSSKDVVPHETREEMIVQSVLVREVTDVQSDVSYRVSSRGQVTQLKTNDADQEIPNGAENTEVSKGKMTALVVKKNNSGDVSQVFPAVGAVQAYSGRNVFLAPLVITEESSNDDDKCRLRIVNVVGNYHNFNNVPLELDGTADRKVVEPVTTRQEVKGVAGNGNENQTEVKRNVTKTDLKSSQNKLEVKSAVTVSDEDFKFQSSRGDIVENNHETELDVKDAAIDDDAADDEAMFQPNPKEHVAEISQIRTSQAEERVTPKPEDRASLEQYQQAQGEDSDENLMGDLSDECDLDNNNGIDLDKNIDSETKPDESDDLDRNGECDLDKSKESVISESSGAESSDNQPLSTTHGFIQLEQRIKVLTCVPSFEKRLLGRIGEVMGASKKVNLTRRPI